MSAPEEVPPLVQLDEMGQPVTTVRLVHPQLPDQSIDVPEESVIHYRRSGWREPAELEPEPEQAPANLADWTKDQLATEAEARGLPKSGTKDELIARLQENDAQAQVSTEDTGEAAG